GKFADGERQDAFRKIAVNAREQIDQVPAIGLGQTGEGLGANLVRQLENARENQPRLLGQDETAGASVSGIGAPVDPAVLLHAIDLSNQGHRLDLEQVGEAGLVDALVAGEVAQHFALCPGEAEEEERPLVETSAKKAGDVVDKKAKAAVEVHGPMLHAKNHQ